MYDRHSLVCALTLCAVLLAACVGGRGGDGAGIGPTITDPTPGQTPDGQTPDGQTPDGQTPDGQTPNGQTPDGQTPNGQTPTGTPTNPTPTNPTPTNPTPTNPTPTNPTPTDPVTTGRISGPEAAMLVATYRDYGTWNVAVQNAIPTYADCLANPGCDARLPAQHFLTAAEASVGETPNYESPFGATATFNPTTGNDEWVATWSGDIAGFRSADPDGPFNPSLTDPHRGLLTRNWVGTAFLEIKAADLSTVLFWTDSAKYLSQSLNSEGQPDSTAPPFVSTAIVSGLPTFPNDDDDDRWIATLSTGMGEKGYFSGDGLFGQFSAEMEAGKPSSAIGHIDRAGVEGTFTVRGPLPPTPPRPAPPPTP